MLKKLKGKKIQLFNRYLKFHKNKQQAEHEFIIKQSKKLTSNDNINY